MTNRPCSDPQPPNLGGSGLKGKRIVLGITGSIAAYKACLIIRGLIKAGAEVQVVITPAGKEFITPITLSALTHKPVISEFFSQRDGTWNSHVDLGLWADAMLIAPCTASTLGKMANGIADNMLITTYLSMKAPVFIAPAMDLDMYQHPSTQQNMERLKSFGNHIIEPASGFLASGLEGKGRMEEPERIVEYLEAYLRPLPKGKGEAYPRPLPERRGEAYPRPLPKGKGDIAGKKVLITAGPTYEKIDPVRFIGNYSSGKMGFTLAEECARRGAEVTLVAGPVALSTPTTEEGAGTIHRIDVESCEEMYQAATTAFKTCDAAILCAAVADFRPETQAKEKIKREPTPSPSLKGGEEPTPSPSLKGGEDANNIAPSKMRGSSGYSEDGLTLRLVANPDIAAALGQMKTEKQVLVGFALETNDEETNAKKKLQKKNLDFIVLNSLQNKGTCFQSDENQISILSASGKKDYEKKTKQEVAKDIVEELAKEMNSQGRNAAGNPLHTSRSQEATGGRYE